MNEPANNESFGVSDIIIEYLDKDELINFTINDINEENGIKDWKSNKL